MDEAISFVIGMIVGGLLLGIGGCHAGAKQGRQLVIDDAIEHGHARYNPTTGEPEWVEKETGE